MQQVLSLPHLLTCLSEKDKYKGTQLYLNEIQLSNDEIYPLIDEALKKTLLEVKTAPMTKLLSLRFFKEILMSANFSLIDLIDEKIEELIIHIAQYNKKSKEVSRGANYFSDTQKVKNDADTQKIGSSYVLLALEIIQMIGKWYKIDEEGDQTRFSQYYTELLAAGVVFPPQSQLNFFKKDDEEKFKKNYKKWAQKNLQTSDNQKVSVQGNQKVQQPPAPAPPLQQKNATISIQQSMAKSKAEVGKQVQKSATLNISPGILNNDQVLTAKISELQLQMTKKDEQIEKLSIALKSTQDKFSMLQKQLQNKESQLLKVQQQLSSVKLLNQKALEKTSALTAECYQIVLSPPKNTDDLIQQIDALEDMMKQSTQGFEKYKQTSQNELNKLKTQNQQLKKTIQIVSAEAQKRIKQQQQQNRLMQEQKAIEERVFRASQSESLRIQDEPKIGTKQMQEKQMIMIKEQLLISKKEVLKDKINLSKELRERLSDVREDKFQESSIKQMKQLTRSLKKTESQHRLKSNQASMTMSNFKRPLNNTQSKLLKTAQNFKPRDEASNKMVTIFPYLAEYFPSLSNEYKNFKQHCLFQLNEPFFENEMIKVALSKPNETQSCFVYIYNKSSSEQKVKLLASSSSISIQGEKIKKAASLTAIQFQLKLGVPDLNMRLPKISIFIGNHKISLTTSSNQKIFDVFLPITLLDYFKMQKTSKKMTSLANTRKTIKYGCNKFVMASSLPTLQQVFPNLATEFNFGEAVRVGSVDCGPSQLRLQITQSSRELSITTEFSDSCELSASLSKIFPQILMWLLRD